MTQEKIIERIKNEAFFVSSKEIDISAVTENLNQYPEIKNNNLMIQFAQKYHMLVFDRIEKKSKDRLHIQIYPFTSPRTIAEWQGEKKNVIGVAWISNASGSIETLFMNEVGEFFNSKTELIADNEEGFFEYLFNVEYDYHAPIMPQTLEILKNAGWYEGRKTDISRLISKYQKEGITLSDAQIDFMQEFGGIKGNDSKDEEFEVCIEPKYSKFRKSQPLDSKDLTTYRTLNIVGNRENVDFLLAGTMGNGMVNFWISTDGRLFADQGVQMGRTIIEGFQWFLLK